MDTANEGPVSNDHYHIGWICALSIELAAALAVLDEYQGMIDDQDPHDTNSYHAGRIQGHDVIIACLPDGEYGTNAAAAVATNMLRTFPNIKCGLLVGIAGGLPSYMADIRLGDVVVSSAESTSSGVVQFDLGKKTQMHDFEQNQDSTEQFVRKGTLNRPPWTFRSALSSLKAHHSSGRNEMSSILLRTLQNPEVNDTFQRPTAVQDYLYLPSYVHANSTDTAIDCSACDPSQVVTRAVRAKEGPKLFYGTILSGNLVIKNAKERDRLRDQFSSDNALCVEMEAAGIMNILPCMVIRGICDYADSHKNSKWHGYAALTAAVFAKNLLKFVSKQSIRREKTVDMKISGIIDERLSAESLSECHRQLHPGTSYEATKNVIASPANGTCRWVLTDDKFVSWNNTSGADLLWISASPGCGKSVLCKSLVDDMLTRNENLTVCYYFFRNSIGEDKLSTALCSILHQLFTCRQSLRKHALGAYKKYGSGLRQEVDVLWDTLISATSDDDANQTVCLIDALDEANDKSRESLIQKLCRFFNNVTQASKPAPKLKFLVTSRPYDDIQDEFEQLSESLPKIRLRGEDKHEQIGREIDQVIRIRVDEIARRWSLSAPSKNRLEHELLTMENRTYLWLELAIDSINKTFKYSSNPNSAVIKKLPKSVDDAYEKLLSNIDVEVEGKARKILLIIIGARRTLTVGELCLALTTHEQADQFDSHHMEQYMQQWCGLLIFFSQGKVYLLHQTVKDFLLHRGHVTAHQSTSWKKSLCETMVEGTMASICARYLCSETARSVTFTAAMKLREVLSISQNVQVPHGFDETSLDIVSFYLYSASFWLSHVNMSMTSLEDSIWREIIDVYLQLATAGNPPWAIAMWEDNSAVLKDCDKYPIFLAMAVGHLNILQRQIGGRGFELETRDRRGRTPLIFAAEHGLQACVELLTLRGAKMNACSETREDALIHAVGTGNLDIVTALLNRGADPNSRGCSSHPLVRAAFAGEDEIADILVRHGSNVNARSGYFGNALTTAAYHGHEALVEMLLRKGARVNEEGGVYNNALQTACVRGWFSIVENLVQHKANLNQEGGLYGSALIASSQPSRLNRSIIKKLVESGARANIELNRMIEIKFATSKRLQQLSELRQSQIDNQAVINAIKHELSNGSIRIAYYRVDFRQLINVFNQYGLSPLSQGLSFESCEPWRELSTLIRHNMPANDGVAPTGSTMIIRQAVQHMNPLTSACADSATDVVKALLAAKAWVNHEKGGTKHLPLHEACRQEDDEIVSLLIKAKADVNAKSPYGGSPLQIACLRTGSLKIVAILLAAKADVNDFDDDFFPPLHASCRQVMWAWWTSCCAMAPKSITAVPLAPRWRLHVMEATQWLSTCC